MTNRPEDDENLDPAFERSPDEYDDPWEALAEAIENTLCKMTDREHDRTVNYDRYAPWRIMIFDLVREVLGIPFFMDRLRRIWTRDGEPNAQERRLIVEILNVWGTPWWPRKVEPQSV